MGIPKWDHKILVNARRKYKFGWLNLVPQGSEGSRKERKGKSYSIVLSLKSWGDGLAIDSIG